ncbi:threonine synthase [Methylobrevis albus]|uniref:Threonine synthase n=1 Tax=Methylobrevis albus TaxID=2793297 RepID=A0A931I2M9_9HYPH|nr:threonine synthase [Methylobrevis albus]MBH0238173.1 threonine synthase [Methylobrevis albus]
MRYVSTRGRAPALSFSDVVVTGLARDGGLYVPETYPQLSAATIAGFAGRSYADVAEAVIAPFVGDDIPPAALRRMIDGAYASFVHPAVTPLVQLGPGHFLLELFHGPTIAFKDVAMQLLARLMDHVLAERGQRATIVAATSGDTGGAAIEAFRGRDNTDIFVLFPHGRVSDVQRRQMTTVADANVHALAVEGTFDDCQALVKAMFNDLPFRDRVGLSGVNSINWGRIVAQVVYYFVAAVALGAPHRPVSFTVPTGNFGDIFAGWVAKSMGLPIERLVVATNVNDIIVRTLETGRYETRGVMPTISPSMDIQVSSNFERLLFEAGGRDAEGVTALMNGLGQSGAFTVPAATIAAIRDGFAAGRTDEAATAATIGRVLADAGYLLDPHTATAVAVAEHEIAAPVPMVTLATAHPAKFPDAVEAASGIRPGLPERLGDLLARAERQSVLANDLAAVENFIGTRARAATQEV